MPATEKGWWTISLGKCWPAASLCSVPELFGTKPGHVSESSFFQAAWTSLHVTSLLCQKSGTSRTQGTRVVKPHYGSNIKTRQQPVARRCHPAWANKRCYLHAAVPFTPALLRMLQKLMSHVGAYIQMCWGVPGMSGEVTEPPRPRDLMAWVLSQWGSLSDHNKLSRAGHCVQQDAASSCGHCVLSGVGDLSILSHLKSFFFIALGDFLLLLLSMP